MFIRRIIHAVFVAALCIIIVGCSKKKSNPFPSEVKSILGEFKTALIQGADELPITLTQGVEDNPYDLDSDTQSNEDILDKDDHSGTVAMVNYSLLETRNANGSGQIQATIVDAADSSRVFMSYLATYGGTSISFSAPPIGAKEYLASDGTGQSFMILKIERTLNYIRVFENDPAGTSGNGTLVTFTPGGGPTIPNQTDGTISGTIKEMDIYIVEFAITTSVNGNVAKIVDINKVSDSEEISRSGSGFPVKRIVHKHDVIVDTTPSATNARKNSNATVLPVGVDGDPNTLVADGHNLNITNGRILGGISNVMQAFDSKVNDAGGTVDLVNDGVGDPTDKDFDGVSIYDMDFTINVSSGPGGLSNGTIEVSVLRLDTKHYESDSMRDLDHPVLDEHFLYGMVSAKSKTGLILYR